MVKFCAKKKLKERIVFFNLPHDQRREEEDLSQYQTEKFKSNYISTTKYNMIDFLPRMLVLEFSKISNLYFLSLAIINFIPEINIFAPFSLISPLVIIFLLSMVKQLLENLIAYSRDQKENNKLCNVLTKEGEIIPKKFKHVVVGDLVILEDGEFVPADILLLSCSDENGVTFINTASLDGEKAPKPRKVIKEIFAGIPYDNDVWNINPRLSFEVRCGAPNPNLFKFKDAYIKLYEDGKPNENRIKLSIDNFLFKSSSIKFSKSVLGMVLYTGNQTKIQLNLEKSHQKVSRLEILVNRRVIIILVLQIIMSLVAIIYRLTKVDEPFEQAILEEYSTNYVFTFFQFFILLSNLIPISLFIYLEVLRFFQGIFMMWNDELKSDPKIKNGKVVKEGISCKVNTFSLNDELGRVQYILSDKTGTLTQNKLQMIGVHVNNFLFGLKETESLDVPGNTHYKKYEHENKDLKFHFWDKEFYNLLYSKETKKLQNYINLGNGFKLKKDVELYQEFMKACVLCHDCMLIKKNPEKLRGESLYSRRNTLASKRNVFNNVLAESDAKEITKYTGPSPDEIAILKGIKSMKYDFMGDFGNNRNILTKDSEVRSFEIKLNFKFSSKRKCSSILVYDEEKDTYALYIKGADSRISEICTNKEELDQALIENENLSSSGLRILYYGVKYLNKREYEEIHAHYHKIINKEIDEKLDDFLKQRVEIDFVYLGFIVMQDKLQNKVPKTIRLLKNAGIKIWMITGDKLETAISISKSTCLSVKGDQIFKISKKEKLDKEKLKAIFDEAGRFIKTNPGSHFVFIIDMEQFKMEFLENNKEWFNVLLKAKSVVFSRTSPKLKGRICRLLKSRSGCVLAIGDGENDVNMINKADVGVGIYGKEGTQATKVADFAIGEFKILWKLVLFSGRINYLRTSNFVLVYFLKNLLFVVPQFIFGFLSAFSGLTIFDGWYITLFNTVFTNLPLFYIGLTDIDIHYLDYQKKNKKYYKNDSISDLYSKQLKESKGKPNLISNKNIKDNYWLFYHESQLNFYFSFTKFLRLAIYSFFFSSIMMLLVFNGFELISTSGKVFGYSELSICTYVFWIFALNLSFMIRSFSFDIITLLLILLTSILPLIIFVFIYDVLDSLLFNQVMTNVVKNINFYLFLFLMLIIYLICELYYKSIFDAIEEPLYSLIEKNANNKEGIEYIKNSIRRYLDSADFENRKRSRRHDYMINK